MSENSHFFSRVFSRICEKKRKNGEKNQKMPNYSDSQGFADSHRRKYPDPLKNMAQTAQSGGLKRPPKKHKRPERLTTRNAVYRNVHRVRIPNSPPKSLVRRRGFFNEIRSCGRNNSCLKGSKSPHGEIRLLRVMRNFIVDFVMVYQYK